jgi:hypothetical protein
MAAIENKVEALEKLWDWAKELQLKTDELRNDVFWSKKIFNRTPLHIAPIES